MPPAPKPDSQRRRTNAPTFDWVTLPAAGRQGPPPELPPLRPWTSDTLDAWARLWSSSPAVAWVQDGTTLHSWAVAHHEMTQAPETGRSVAALLAEMRAIEDRDGLSPKALLSLRWRIVDLEAEVVPIRTTAPTGSRIPTRHRLTVTD